MGISLMCFDAAGLPVVAPNHVDIAKTAKVTGNKRSIYD